jgi:hypothetical protein
LTRSKTIGCPPTDLKARTGELTPPGINFWAAAKTSSDLVVLKLLVINVDSLKRFNERLQSQKDHSQDMGGIW